MKNLIIVGVLASVLMGCGQNTTNQQAKNEPQDAASKVVKETGIRTLVINDIGEINANADKIKAEINAEDRALIEEYFSRAEALRLINGDKSMFGVTLGEAIEKTKAHFEKKSIMDEKITTFNQKYKVELVAFEKSTKYSDKGIDLKIKFTNNSDNTISAIDGWIELRVDGVENTDSLLLGTHKFDKPLAKGESAEIVYWTEPSSLATIKIEQGNAVTNLHLQNMTVLFTDGTTDKVEQMF